MPARPLWRVWSAAAANGAEALTAALVLEEAGLSARLLLTDIDPVMLEAARQGEYRESELRHLSPDRRRRILEPPAPRAPVWRVRPEVAARMVVRRLDLLHDPYPPGPFDLILCRNVLIYFRAPDRERVLGRLASRLGPDGLLFLGATELIGRPEAHGLEWVAPALYRARPPA
ncbi:MAG: methyltransferase domain-containing protein, partial [Firmicutes bacterium]|nr:methyltransferase domain-containing protein [Bacillota bacterium]